MPAQTDNQYSSQDLGKGITLIDTAFQRPQLAACYVMQEDDELAIIETGTKDTVPLILSFLESNNLALEQVKYVIVTHVHLDHAGGAGLLMQKLSNAKLVVHPKGARHMIDPAKLQAGATAVYGDAEFKKSYGNLIPISENNIITPEDRETLTLGKRLLTFLDTPGHARHHFCIFDDKSQGFFTGDTFGLAYQELANHNGAFIFPTTTPVQFDPDALKASINRLMTYNPKCMYLTHFGKVDNLPPLAAKLLSQVDRYVDIANSCSQPSGQQRIEEVRGKLVQHLLTQLEQHQCELPIEEQLKLVEMDALLNAQGLDVWLG